MYITFTYTALVITEIKTTVFLACCFFFFGYLLPSCVLYIYLQEQTHTVLICVWLHFFILFMEMERLYCMYIIANFCMYIIDTIQLRRAVILHSKFTKNKIPKHFIVSNQSILHKTQTGNNVVFCIFSLESKNDPFYC